MNTTRTCFQCGSPLIEVSKVTNRHEGAMFPQTSSVFRCTNDVCEAAREKETAKRLKLKQDREDAEIRRADQRKKAHEEKVRKVLEEQEAAEETTQI